jgi:hypothetical protein
MSVFAEALEDLFADPNLARDALWRAGGGGDGLPVRLALRRPDQTSALFGVHASLPKLAAEIRASEVAAPAEGDLVEVDGVSYRVRGADRDSERLLWRLSLEEA